jgi:hypothetical protein
MRKIVPETVVLPLKTQAEWVPAIKLLEALCALYTEQSLIKPLKPDGGFVKLRLGGLPLPAFPP